jgi:hypothetical protein
MSDNSQVDNALEGLGSQFRDFARRQSQVAQQLEAMVCIQLLYAYGLTHLDFYDDGTFPSNYSVSFPGEGSLRLVLKPFSACQLSHSRARYI